MITYEQKLKHIYRLCLYSFGARMFREEVWQYAARICDVMKVLETAEKGRKLLEAVYRPI